jgi:epoxyqueuosine reductase
MAAGLSEDLRRFALDTIGFDLIGIATAEPLAGAARLHRWLEHGRHGTMAWMAESADERADIRRFLPGARSLVSVAVGYGAAHDPEEPDPGIARIARYARRGDYHAILKRRLVALGRFLAAHAPGARWRVAVDTAPVLEREVARRAGLGWIGRNTCLVNRRFGCELLLGELVTDLELEPDAPGPDHCGTCTACLDACPTGALDAVEGLDSRLCISYLTIEHHGPFEPAQSRALGGHLFGCDLCLTACPFTRRARGPCNPALATRPHLGTARTEDLLELDAEGWFQFSKGTPLRRLDFGRFRRNLEAVAHNQAARPPARSDG